MADSSDDNESDLDDEQLFELLDQHTVDGAIVESELPDVLRNDPRVIEMVACLKLLDSMAGPPAIATSAAGMDSSISQQLPREFGCYVLERELGRGGMGVVYLARHIALGTHFALKMIRTSEFASEEEVRRFFQEARAAASLRHPNIVSVHDAGEVDSLPYLVMSFIDGETLADRIQRERLDHEQALELIETVSRAIEYLHEQGIIHRDLKPSNILIDHNGTPFVTDFGLAKVFENDGTKTQTGTVIGTPAYMAPEQAWGTPDDVTAQSDIYGLGAIFYELLTGRTPFPEENPLDQMLRLRDAEPIPVRRLQVNLPIEYEQVCMRCLEKRNIDRYASAVELADDLNRVRHREPITIPAIGLWQRLRRWSRRNPPLASHLAAFVVMALIVQTANIIAGEERAPYRPVMAVLAIWTGVCYTLQQLLHRDIDAVRFVWIAMDAALFTAAVVYAEGPVESLLVGYSLLIVASSMWFQPELVWVMTATSAVAYCVLLNIRGAEGTPIHYPYIVIGILIVVGGIVAALVRRVRMLLQVRADATKQF